MKHIIPLFIMFIFSCTKEESLSPICPIGHLEKSSCKDAVTFVRDTDADTVYVRYVHFKNGHMTTMWDNREDFKDVMIKKKHFPIDVWTKTDSCTLYLEQ